MTRLFPPEADVVARIHAQLEHLANINAETSFLRSDQKLTLETLSTLIETAFWAGLQSEEGRPTRARVTVAARKHFPHAIAFALPVAYEKSAIVKLAPAVPLGGCLGVTIADETFQIWGIAHGQPVGMLDIVTIEIAGPGTVRIDIGPFRPYAVLDGQSNDILSATGTDLAHYLQRRLDKAFLTDDILETQAVWRECLALADLVRMILSDGHGGAVLIVPSETGAWSEWLNPFAFRFETPDTTIRDVIRNELNDVNSQGQFFVELSQAALPDDIKNRLMGTLPQSNRRGWEAAVRATAALARVDGAIVMTQDLRLLGFGAKIEFSQGREVLICKLKAMPGPQEVVRSRLDGLSGMRHQSAARFIAENNAAVAIVVSQDRHVSLMHWDDKLNSVCVVRNAEWWV